MKKRRLAREGALQFLYQHDLNAGEDLDADLAAFWEQQESPDPQVTGFANLLVRGVIEHRPELDVRLAGYLKNWTLNRLAVVDRNILRLALYEILHRDDIPPVVSINEAIELGKIYGGEDSGKFVNGILDKVRSDVPRPARTAAGGPATPGPNSDGKTA
jgi:N utilization substance protein B